MILHNEDAESKVRFIELSGSAREVAAACAHEAVQGYLIKVCTSGIPLSTNVYP